MTSNLVVFMKQPTVIQRFQDVLGRGANGYIQSVIIAASDEKLSGCSELSIMRAALRAASLGLSCDPVQKEAQLIPRNRKIKGKNGEADKWVKEASFEPHYLGLYKLAIRTGKYWTINVIHVKKNQEVRMGRDGLHWVFENDMRVDHFPIDRITAKNIGDVKGWLGYFKTTKGFERTVYMSVEEIMEHATKYSDAYKRDIEKGTKYSTWNDPDILPTMQMKTVLRELLKWADTSGDAGEKLKQALDSMDNEVIDAEGVSDLEQEYPEGSNYEKRHTEAESVSELMGESKAVPHPELKKSKRDTEKPQGVIGWLLDRGINNTSHASQIANILKLGDIWNENDTSAVEKRYSNYRSLRDSGVDSAEAAKKVLGA